MTSNSNNSAQPILVNGTWRPANATGNFLSVNPATGDSLPGDFPVSSWDDIEEALSAAASAFTELQKLPRTVVATFLQRYADLIEERAEEIAQAAATETALPYEPRLKNVELPRTTGQLRKAAEACVASDWRMPTIDAENNIRSVLEPLGPVFIIGPNNFPFAFNAISGGDFAAAIAAGCPVIAKAHHLHPTTSRMLAEAAHDAATDLPAGTVQMLYAMDQQHGLQLAQDHRLGAVAFTGSRGAGLKLKAAADEVGKPAFLEMSSVNPVVILPGALERRFDAIVDETVTSALMGGGQFCTNPGLIITIANDTTEKFIQSLAQRYAQAPPATLLGQSGVDNLDASIEVLKQAGATMVEGGGSAAGTGFKHANTLLRTDAAAFLKSPAALQTEAFGNCTLCVTCRDAQEIHAILEQLEASLTGCIYSAEDGSEDDTYELIARALSPRVGRLLNDKMPTGVAVSPAMNHGGSFPATGHPHFTAVGLPAACRRFTRLVCYDNVRPHRLPDLLRDAH